MHVLKHTFTFVATLVRFSALGTLLVYVLRGRGVLSTCIYCIDLLQAMWGTSQTYELPWSWRQDSHPILLPLVQAHLPGQALALKEHGHRCCRLSLAESQDHRNHCSARYWSHFHLYCIPTPEFTNKFLLIFISIFLSFSLIFTFLWFFNRHDLSPWLAWRGFLDFTPWLCD